MSRVICLTDSELCALLPKASARQAADYELRRRHGWTALDSAQSLYRDRNDAEKAVLKAFDRTLGHFVNGGATNTAWIARLLSDLRHLAAEDADRGKPDGLSPRFRAWLDQRQQAHDQPYTRVVTDAEDGCLLLRAVQGLSGFRAAEVWNSLTPPAAINAATTTSPAPAARTRELLANGYVRLYATGLPDRHCRHLAAQIADQAARSEPLSAELGSHLTRCDTCSHALSELQLIHCWEPEDLRDSMLIWSHVSGHGSTGVRHQSSRPPAPVVTATGRLDNESRDVR
ncbi:hypothetical protein AB0E25_40970 [Streptomyces bobili]|uniref:hypothetical protein n=1 Tax=Streptomyces bobili TaxID=67280 RepID=UPI0033E73DDC